MKKFIVFSILGLCLLAVSPAVMHANIVKADAAHNHNYIEQAEQRSSKFVWVCSACGDRRIYTSSSTYPAQAGCGGDYRKNHIWQRT